MPPLRKSSLKALETHGVAFSSPLKHQNLTRGGLRVWAAYLPSGRVGLQVSEEGGGRRADSVLAGWQR